MTELHIRKCMELLQSPNTDAGYDLPGNISFRMDRHTIRFQPTEYRPECPAPEIPYDGSDYENHHYKMIFHRDSSPENQPNITFLLNKEENIYKLSIHQTLDFDKIIGALKIRNRCTGDTFHFGGMTRRVKKLLTAQKLTAEEKACLPILCDDSGIVWIPGFPLRDGMEYTGEGTPLTVSVLS